MSLIFSWDKKVHVLGVSLGYMLRFFFEKVRWLDLSFLEKYKS